jgi:hypothetical protein
MKPILHSVAAIPFAIFLTTTSAYAADPAVKCESSKLKESSKYAACRLKADARAVSKGLPVDYTRCEDRFGDRWSKIEAKAGPAICPSEGDQVSMDIRITTDATEIATLLAGGSPPASCGNATVDAGEDCDLGDLNGETCVTQGLFGDGLACAVGCVFDTSDCSAARYEDTGIGTVIDHQTGLEWQKTDDAGGLTDKDNTYSWSAAIDEPSGTAFTELLYGLNECASDGVTIASGHAGHCDWRIPQLDELLTIADCSFGDPCIDQAVFGPTNASSLYWTANPVDFPTSLSAWGVYFGTGTADCAGKNALVPARAVRGGS